MEDTITKITLYQPHNCGEIASLFYDTIHTINAHDYTHEQLQAWASGTIDMIAWNQSFIDHHTLVAMEGDIIVGFGDIDNTGYLNRLYAHKDYQRKGIARALCNKLEKRYAVQRIITHASITAQPFFQKRGYFVVKEQLIERNGVLLINYVMKKLL